MPGNGGMRPDHSSFSVPVLMPLQSMSTTTSAVARRGQLQAGQGQLLGLLQHDGQGVHARLLGHKPAATNGVGRGLAVGGHH
jgi:hypothetical protein